MIKFVKFKKITICRRFEIAKSSKKKNINDKCLLQDDLSNLTLIGVILINDHYILKNAKLRHSQGPETKFSTLTIYAITH